MIRLKNEGDRARIRGVSNEIQFAIWDCYEAWKECIRVLQLTDMVITSIGELGDFRKKGSKHLSGNAFDVRTRDLNDFQINMFVDKCRDALGPDFDVVVESNHIHVEFDPEP